MIGVGDEGHLIFLHIAGPRYRIRHSTDHDSVYNGVVRSCYNSFILIHCKEIILCILKPCIHCGFGSGTTEEYRETHQSNRKIDNRFFHLFPLLSSDSNIIWSENLNLCFAIIGSDHAGEGYLLPNKVLFCQKSAIFI